MKAKEIIGVVLVRDEDRFLGRALASAAGFCDRFLLFDHGSQDGTSHILQSFSNHHPNASYFRVDHPSESQRKLQPFCGGQNWLFGLDGDEIYDYSGLIRLKKRILEGEFDRDWMVMGTCLHVDEIDETTGVAHGFLAPPSRTITKLYNFAAIESWNGRSMERLHGGSPVFKPGYAPSQKRLLYEETPWDSCDLRCLHLCFCQRSSLHIGESRIRRNIFEIYSSRIPVFLQHFLARIGSRNIGSTWKRDHYRRGPLSTVQTGDFFQQ